MRAVQDGSIHVALEYMDRGSLSDVIHGWRGMEYGEDLIAAVTFQVCISPPITAYVCVAWATSS